MYFQGLVSNQKKTSKTEHFITELLHICTVA